MTPQRIECKRQSNRIYLLRRRSDEVKMWWISNLTNVIGGIETERKPIRLRQSMKRVG